MKSAMGLRTEVMKVDAFGNFAFYTTLTSGENRKYHE